MSQPAANDSRYMMIALARSDAADLAQAEQAIDRMDPIRFNTWAAQFATDSSLLRTAAPVEVAVLVRTIESHPGWIHDPTTLHQLHQVIGQQLGDFSHDVVNGSRAHAVDTIRQAQNPELADFRAGVLIALDRAHQDVARHGGPIQTAFANRLAERNLITTDAELGEPFERIPVSDTGRGMPNRPQPTIAFGPTTPGGLPR